MENTILTPELSAQARAELSLSQAKVSNDVGLSRGYLSQYESRKRVLNDNQVKSLQEYYQGYGWVPAESKSEPTDAESALVIDGVVVADHAEVDVEQLFEDYYATQSEIDELRSQEIARGWLFGGIDQMEAEVQCKPLLLLYRRLDEIKDMIQGRVLMDDEPLALKDSDIKTVGDYVDMLTGRLVKPEQPA
ncbi:helix-turn-helix transcriptional regulator [Bacterioplanoides sp. SCSIO 12839]|uniref:helix-turn-helix domain-containing protein n=1 Tax=Bacterioplanoides sp. SCSIO 12839 TaxID=2829569 RepID=UPI002105868A|nr:helix-turn-helix transcriptional regulator [Bacterioplanoides sp. SCSIO 12839]UTW46766.1 helix-turn-helix transcriptional regulator [Bacterioplanoides sp. SCSIO 12839]